MRVAAAVLVACAVLGGCGEPSVPGRVAPTMNVAIDVEGLVVEGPPKGFEDGKTLRVRRVNGVATQAAIELKLVGGEPVLDLLAVGSSYRLRAIERSLMVGTPPGDRGDRSIQTVAEYRSHRLEVLNAVAIETRAAHPADFVGRSALLEGIGHREGERVVLAVEEWTIDLDGVAWDETFEGRAIEAYGPITERAAPATHAMRVERCGLVRLADQVGREVTLRGYALRGPTSTTLLHREGEIAVELEGDVPPLEWFAPAVLRGRLERRAGDAPGYAVRGARWEACPPLLDPEIAPRLGL